MTLSPRYLELLPSQTIANDYKFFLVNDLLLNKAVPTNPIEVKSIISNKVEQITKKNDTDITFEFWLNNQITDRISFVLAPSYRIVLLSINRNFFIDDDGSSLVLDFCKTFYKFFSPLYGYGPTDYDNYPIFSKVDIGKIEALYPYNILGPDIVSTFGRKKLHSIPAWQVDDLYDGGIFIVMELNLFER